MSRVLLQRSSVVFGLLAGAAQLAIALVGDAVGGHSVMVVVLAIDAVAALVGAVIVLRWPTPGLVLTAAAAACAAVMLFFSTWLEIGVAGLLLLAAAAHLSSGRVR